MSIRPEGRIRVPCSAWRSVPGGLDAVVPLALTPRERRLTAAAALAVTASGLVAAAYVTLWCVGARPDELFLVLFLGVVGFAPVWAVAAAGLRLRQRLAGAWVDTRALPRPTFVLLAGAPLVLLNTAWEALGPLDPWRWAAVLPAISAALATLAYGSTLRRRWQRRDASRWSPGVRR
jgi:hypothetical protein